MLDTDATVLEVNPENGKDVVVLDQTIFYPQGGGQPYDTGFIKSEVAIFRVDEVRFTDGVVKHIGTFETGTFSKGDRVSISVDRERRRLHSRLHSAGHLVDKAIYELKLNWIPGKGYHFPNGPYDEYKGSLDSLDKETLKANIEKLCNQYIQKGGKTEIVFMTKEEMKKVCHYTPDFPEEKERRARIVIHDGYYMPCGGTPVADVSEIGPMTIRKIKQEKENIRVGYDILK